MMGFPQNLHLWTFSMTVAYWHVYQVSQRHKILLQEKCTKNLQNGGW